MILHCKYFYELDRFAVFVEGSKVDMPVLRESFGYTSLEYMRYIPIGSISLSDINALLSQAPREICYELTSACNLNCNVCIAMSSDLKSHYLSEAAFRQSIEDLPSEVVRVTITGGEPTLHPDLPRLVDYCARAGKCVVLSTNGFYPQRILQAAEFANKIIVTVSLHGPCLVHDAYVGLHGSYERSVETIEVAATVGPVHVFTTATPGTVSNLAELSLNLADLPVTEHRINLIKPSGRIGSNLVTYDQVERKVRGIHVPHKLSIKRQDQPYFFISHNDEKEKRSERRY